MSLSSPSSDFDLAAADDSNDEDSDSETSSTTNEGILSVKPSNPARWDWVNPWDTLSLPLDPPTERSEAKRWLRDQLRYSNSSSSWVNYDDRLSDDYLDALKDGITMRDDIQIRWDGLTTDPLVDWATPEWCREQVERLQNPNGPMPTFDAADLHTHRRNFFQAARTLFEKLLRSRRHIIELARARKEFSSGAMSTHLFYLRVRHNIRCQKLQHKVDRTLPIIRGLYLLTAVAIIRAT
ncbi:hypothetical protein K435DRAFT_807641 [Dendrothele bispora CBS 962.96]|uniref:Uncharacterized protein n=1 Tax=Dendrothele bispora (strain CBS 962.96) TaxID=1314807 RepID=A0A4V4HCG5_DENBC|nr:hypothetical protein K435DRAFT_807641 [Dendrothele bispora CBS 962.96]